MTATNLIIKNSNNPVLINITGLTDESNNPITLNDFDNIICTFKGDTRTLIDNPNDVIINTPTQLRLEYQDTTEIASGYWVIKLVNGDYPDGLVVTSQCKGNLQETKIC